MLYMLSLDFAHFTVTSAIQNELILSDSTPLNVFVYIHISVIQIGSPIFHICECIRTEEQCWKRSYPLLFVPFLNISIIIFVNQRVSVCVCVCVFMHTRECLDISSFYTQT
jgi:hypothetical protein